MPIWHIKHGGDTMVPLWHGHKLKRNLQLNSSPPCAVYMRQLIGSGLVQKNGLSPIRRDILIYKYFPRFLTHAKNWCILSFWMSYGISTVDLVEKIQSVTMRMPSISLDERSGLVSCQLVRIISEIVSQVWVVYLHILVLVFPPTSVWLSFGNCSKVSFCLALFCGISSKSSFVISSPKLYI